jgi:hypothetical protein
VKVWISYTQFECFGEFGAFVRGPLYSQGNSGA